MPHTNEEMREKLYKLWKELRLEDKTSFEEIPAVIQIENFINQEISDLKKSIREEIKEKGHQQDDDTIWCDMDEILSLKSLE